MNKLKTYKFQIKKISYKMNQTKKVKSIYNQINLILNNKQFWI